MSTLKKIELKNGTYEFIQNNEQLADIIGRFMGNDVKGVVLDLISAADFTERKLDTDLESYEASLENHASTFNDIKDILNDSINQIEKSKRLDKNQLEKKLGRVIHMIDENT